MRIAAACFGHQIVGRYWVLGVGGMMGWEARVTEIDLAERGREVFGKSSLVGDSWAISYLDHLHFPKIRDLCFIER